MGVYVIQKEGSEPEDNPEELPTTAQMHVQSGAENLSKTRWAEVVVQGICKKKISFWSKLGED